jgi:hypothetical protein
MTSLASSQEARAPRGPRRGRASRRSLLHPLPLLTTLFLTLALLSACGEDAEDDTSPGQCVPACGLGFNCFGGACIPVGGSDVGLDVDPNNTDVDAADAGPEETGENNSTPGDADVAVDPDVEEDVEPDVEEDVEPDVDVDADDPRCTADAECTGGKVCDLASGACVDPPEDVCTTDADCSGLLVCDTASGDCVEAPEGICASNADCSADKSCLNGRCVEQQVECISGVRECPEGLLCLNNECESFVCTADTDCASGRRCQVNTGLCRDCLTDAECPGNQTCNVDFKQCMEAMTGCTADADCLDGRVCASNVCEDAACTADASEPGNNTEAGATALSTSEISQSLCGFDVDWFSFPLSAGDGFVLRMEYSTSLGGVEMKLVDGSLQEYGRANGQGQDGALVFVMEAAPTSQTYYAAIQNFTGNRTYSLDYTVYPGGLCANDGAEPDNDRTQAVTAVSERPYNRRLCGPDADWFAIQVPAGQRIRAVLNTDEGNPPGIEFYPGDATRPSLRDVTDQEIRSLSQTAQTATLYYVRVFTAQSSHESRYTLTLSTIQP